jgi:hypothetical protein
MRTLIRAEKITACMAATGVLLLTGCGGTATTKSSKTATTLPTRTVTTTAIEDGIKQQLSSPGAEVTSVTCPGDVTVEVGTTFNCSVSWSNGATGKVKVTETSRGHYTYTPVSGSVQVPGPSVEKSVQQQLAKQGAPNAQVHCPANIIVKVGTTVTCNVSGAIGAATGTVTFTFSDSQGSVDPSSVKTS